MYKAMTEVTSSHRGEIAEVSSSAMQLDVSTTLCAILQRASATTSVFIANLYATVTLLLRPSRKHLRTKVTSDLRLTYSKNGVIGGWY